jgi:hypothetical protein
VVVEGVFVERELLVMAVLEAGQMERLQQPLRLAVQRTQVVAGVVVDI